MSARRAPDKGLVDNAGPGYGVLGSVENTGSRGVENTGPVENTGSRFFTQEKELCYPSEFLFDLPRYVMRQVR